MINRDKLDNLDLNQPAVAPGKMIDHMTITELMSLRAQIDKHLPAKKLNEMDLEHELVIQLQQVKELQHTVFGDDDVPANQKAQVANSITSILSQLTKMQTELYNAERVKVMEQALVKTLEEWPDQGLRERFLQLYEDIYRNKQQQ